MLFRVSRYTSPCSFQGGQPVSGRLRRSWKLSWSWKLFCRILAFPSPLGKLVSRRMGMFFFIDKTNQNTRGFLAKKTQFLKDFFVLIFALPERIQRILWDIVLKKKHVMWCLGVFKTPQLPRHRHHRQRWWKVLAQASVSKPLERLKLYIDIYFNPLKTLYDTVILPRPSVWVSNFSPERSVLAVFWASNFRPKRRIQVRDIS